MIRLKNFQEIEKIRQSCVLAAETLEMISEHVGEGISTYDLDRICHAYIIKRGAYPSPLNYNGYPRSICTSLNETVCHGIPDKRVKLKEGDILNIDITVYLNGYHGDTSRMYTVGQISAPALNLIQITEEALYRGIRELGPEKRLGDMGYAIQTYVEKKGYSVVRDFIGHGIGKDFHEDPPVHHIGEKGKGVRLKPGMTFTVEPMINIGTYEVEVQKDGWTVLTKDRKLSAQFEHTVAITTKGVEILTVLPGKPKEQRFFP
jgi:methionyl aminopeptidase